MSSRRSSVSQPGPINGRVSSITGSAPAESAAVARARGEPSIVRSPSGAARAIEHELARLGYPHQSAVAPTPAAAALLTQASPGERVVGTLTQLPSRLTALPLGLLELPLEVRSALHSAGLRRIGEVLALPAPPSRGASGPRPRTICSGSPATPPIRGRPGDRRGLSGALRIRRRSPRDHRAAVSAAAAAAGVSGLPARA